MCRARCNHQPQSRGHMAKRIHHRYRPQAAGPLPADPEAEPLPTDPDARKQALAAIQAAREFAKRYNTSSHKLAADRLAERVQRYRPGELTIRSEQLKPEILADALAKAKQPDTKAPSERVQMIARLLDDLSTNPKFVNLRQDGKLAYINRHLLPLTRPTSLRIFQAAERWRRRRKTSP